MKKYLSLILSSLAFILGLAFVTPTPAQAKGLNFDLPNFFTKIKNSTQRFYLKTMPGDKSGQTVLQQSAYQLEQVETTHYESQVGLKIKNNGQKIGAVDLKIGGPVEIQNVYQPKTTKQKINFNGKFNFQGQTLSFAADLIMADETFYLKLNEVPALPTIDLSQLTQKWLSIPIDSQLTSQMEKTQQFTEKEQEKIKAINKELLNKTELSKAKKKELQDTPVFVIEATLPAQALSNYFEKINAISLNKIDNESQKKLIKQSNKKMQEGIEKIAPISLTIWVDRTNFYLRKVETSLQLDEVLPENNSQTTRGLTANQPDEMELNIKIEFDQYNQPVEITVPSSSQPLREVMGSMMRSFGGSQFPVTGRTAPNLNPTQPGIPTPPQQKPSQKPNPGNTTMPSIPEIPDIDY